MTASAIAPPAGATGPAGVSALLDGWVDDSAATWIYASATTFTVAGDRTAVFSKGTRLKLTQTTVKYFVVVGSSHAAGTTTVTITAGSDYTLANASITSPYYSYAASPQGWPSFFNYLPTITGFSGTPTIEFAKFSVTGKVCTLWLGIQGTSNATGFTVTYPIVSVGTANDPYIVTPVRDNGSYFVGQIFQFSSTVLKFGPSLTSGIFTASGTKEGYVNGLTYPI